MGWSRRILATALVVFCLAWASPGAAQDEPAPQPTGVTVLDDVEEAQPESAVIRDEDSSATIRRIRRDLLVIAAVMTAALGLYVWHTSPSRRLRLATQQAEAVLDEPEKPEGSHGG